MKSQCHRSSRLRPFVSTAAALLLVPGLLPDTAEALAIQSLALQRNYRFYVGVNKAFVGDPYNWSGVARTVETAKWGAMISPSYFVSANHWHPANGETFRFYYTNDASGAYEDRTVLSGQFVGTADLWLGKLSAPVSSSVAKYPILRLATNDDYYHLPLNVIGRPHDDNAGTPTKIHMGLNWIDSTPYDTYNWSGSAANPNKALYADGGDSGGSSFIISNGVPTVVGTHWYPNTSTFIPNFVTQLNAAMTGGEQVTVQTTYVAPVAPPTPPTPASSSWIVDAGGGWTSGINWLAGTYPNGVGQIATFNCDLTAGRTVSLDGALTLGGMVFNDTVLSTGQGNISNSGYGISLGANNLTLDTGTAGYNASDLVVIDVPATNLVGHNITNGGDVGKLVLTDNAQINVANNVEFSFESVRISGSRNLTKTGTGQFLLGGDNAASGYSGNIRLEAGTLQPRNNANVLGTGTLTWTNNGSVSLVNYSTAPAFPNALVLEKTSGVNNNFEFWNNSNTDITWAGNISSNGVALAVNFGAGFSVPNHMIGYTGNNSGLLFAVGKGFTSQNANYIGVGNANALGTGNSVLVTLNANGTNQGGVLATIPTTIASPINVGHAGSSNVMAAVLGGTLASGTATYSGVSTLNFNNMAYTRQAFLRSETGGTIVFNSSSVIGNGSSNGSYAPLTKIGGGRVELNGNNTYMGATSVRSGELVAGHNNALGAAATTVSLGEATTVLTNVRVATKGGETMGTYTSGAGNPGTYTTAPTSIDGVTLALNDRVLIKEYGTKNGIYKVTDVANRIWVRDTDLDADAEIQRGLQVTVTAGTVNINRVYFQAQASTAMVLNTTPMDWHLDIANPAASLLNNGVTISRNINVVANGSTGKSILGGANTTGTGTFSGAVTLYRNLTTTAASGGAVDFAGAITGGFAVTKEGMGKVVFSTAKGYTGATSVTAGVLAVNNALASSGVTVSSGATLQGSGTITNGVTVAGTLAPGNSIGTLAVGAAAFTTGGVLAVEADGTGSGSADRLSVGGNLNLANAALNLTILSALNDPAHVIASYGTLTGTFASVVNLPAGYGVVYNYNSLHQIALVQTGWIDYSGWTALFPGFSDTAADADPDHDGLTNLQEYAFGLNPTLGSSANPISAPFNKGTRAFSYTRRLPSLTGLVYTYQYSTALSGWTTFPPEATSSNSGSPVEAVKVTVPAALTGGPKFFVRVVAQ